MTRLCAATLIAMILMLLQSCDVPLDHEWYERTDGSEYYETEGSPASFMIITKKFEKSDTADGKKKYIFKTNDSKFISNENIKVWEITDTSTPYPTTVTASISRQSGSSTAGFGILFAARKSSGKEYFLTVMINTSGQYMIGKQVAEDFTVIQDWKRFDSLKRGYGVQNIIKVSLSGNAFNLYFNNVLAETFQDTIQPKLSTGAHGYIVSIPPTENLPQKFVEATFIE